MYIAIRRYSIVPGKGREFLERVHESFVPLISRSRGFIAYDARQIGSQHMVTASAFDTQAAAEASILQALRWAQENIAEFILGLPRMRVQQARSLYSPAPLPAPHNRQTEKRLVLDLTFEVVKPGELGEKAYEDPRIREMVGQIRDLLTSMKNEPVRRDAVIYRFEGDILPEEETRKLYTADEIILIKRGRQLAGYAEINRDTNEWLNRDRYEGDILVDPAIYRKNEDGSNIERGIGEQGLLEMRRQGRLMHIENIELDVYLRNQPMHRFLDHLITTYEFPLTKNDMKFGRPLDSTYLLICKDASNSNATHMVS